MFFVHYVILGFWVVGITLGLCPQAALATRDLARTLQQREEAVLLTEGKDRDKKLHDTR